MIMNGMSIMPEKTGSRMRTRFSVYRVKKGTGYRGQDERAAVHQKSKVPLSAKEEYCSNAYIRFVF